MKDYIKAFQVGIHSTDMIDMVSEVFDSKDEAMYFADCFKHNYKANTEIRETPDGGHYVVLMNQVQLRLVRSNFRKRIEGYEFANWKYITR